MSPTGVTENIGNLQFPDRLQGWAVGTRGLLLHTTDGGGSWSSRTLDSSFMLTSVFFITPTTGWVSASFGNFSHYAKILKTVDGGATWSTIYTDSTTTLLSMYFLDEHTGFAAGRYRMLLATTDGGAHWEKKGPTRSTTQYQAIRFADHWNGWAVGTGGLIVKTTDGGVEWFMQQSRTDNILYAVSAVDAFHAWVVGSRGSVIHTIDGGGPPIIPPVRQPLQAFMAQNFPNPYILGSNAETKIRYNFVSAGRVKLEVFDVLGRKVATLVDADQSPQPSGSFYEVSFHGNDLASGIYFYRLVTRDFTEIGKMALVK